MKNYLVILMLFLSVLSVSATEASKFVEQKYTEQTGCKSVKITVKKEHTEEYQQPIGSQMVPAITYGYGDKCKKIRITYICLLDENCLPFWCFIVPGK